MGQRRLYFCGTDADRDLTHEACVKNRKPGVAVNLTDKGLSIEGPPDLLRDMIIDTESAGSWSGQRNASPLNETELEEFLAYKGEPSAT